MRKHIKIYHEALDIPFTHGVYRRSELSDTQGTDIHHIERRGMGGSKSLDRIENLICLNTTEHIALGDKKQYKQMLFIKHYNFLTENGVKFDKEWMKEQIARC